MEDPRAVHLDDADRDAFLGTGGTGVLSFPTENGDAPHSIPVSYGYDAETGHFFFRLAYGAHTEKPDPTAGPVTFVVHGETGDGWRSVVARGPLEATDDEAISTTALDALQRVEIPLVDIFERSPREVSFGFYRLSPDSVTGRMEADR